MRFGRDKLSEVVEGQTVLDWVLDAWSFADEQIVVGPVRPTHRPVRWCREDPPGGGPAAGVATALQHARNEWIAIAAGDAPLVGAVVSDLRAAAVLAVEQGADGAWLVDGAGQPQPLATIARKSALIAALSDAHNASLLRRLETLALQEVKTTSDVLRDVDTPEDQEYVSQLLAAFTRNQAGRSLDPGEGAANE